MSVKQFIISIFIFLTFCSAFIQTTSAAETIDFSARDLEGNLHSIEQYRGKWIVVNYWGVFCGPCLREMPELSIFHTQHHDAVVLGINQEELPTKALERFRDKMKITFPLLSVPLEQATPFGKVAVLPTTFIINPQGKLVAKQQGAITLQTLEDYIKRKKQKALQEKLKKAQSPEKP